MPTCTSHGHTASGAASMVIARVAVKWAPGTSSSPGIGALDSAALAPHRRWTGRMTGETAMTGSAARVDISRAEPLVTAPR